MLPPLPAARAGRRRVLAALLVVASLTVVAVGCSGSDEPPSPATGTSPVGTAVAPTDPALAYPLFADPAAPVCIGLARRAGIVLAARPSAGERWRVVTAPDPAVAVPVGTEFVTGNTALPGVPDTEILSYAGEAVGATAVEVVLLGADGAPLGDGLPVRFQLEVTATGECPPPPLPPLPPEVTTTSLPAEG